MVCKHKVSDSLHRLAGLKERGRQLFILMGNATSPIKLTSMSFACTVGGNPRVSSWEPMGRTGKLHTMALKPIDRLDPVPSYCGANHNMPSTQLKSPLTSGVCEAGQQLKYILRFKLQKQQVKPFIQSILSIASYPERFLRALVFLFFHLCFVLFYLPRQSLQWLPLSSSFLFTAAGFCEGEH